MEYTIKAIKSHFYENFMNVLVGGTGFIGTALAEKLIQQGERVICIARTIPEQKIDGVVYHAVDILSNSDQIAPILSQGACVYLLNGQNSASFDATSELEGFKRVLNVVRASGPSKVLFASTALAYGECSEAANENQSLAPRDSYAQYKVSCESVIQEELSNIPVGILRLGNVYGSERNRGFIGLALKKISEASEIQLNGDGLQESDYVFLDDVVSAMIAVRDGLKESDVINIVTGKSVTLLGVIALLSDVVGRSIPFSVTGVPVMESQIIRVDNTKLREKYGFVPRIFLKEGLRKTLDRYKIEF